MTAINAILKRDRAIMMTDASMYTPTGEVVGFGLKTITIPNLKAAIAVRGAQKAVALLAMEMAFVYQDFDQMLAAAEVDLPDFFNNAFMHLSDLGMADIDIVVIGWSDADNCAKGVSFTSSDDEVEFIDGWTISPFPDTERENLRAAGAIAELHWTEHTFDPIRHGIPFMEAQRRMAVPINGQPTPVHIVGGHILLTEVTRDGVSQRVIHRWDDKAGEPIRPEPFIARPTTHMTRQQRRAMERQQRKSHA